MATTLTPPERRTTGFAGASRPAMAAGERKPWQPSMAELTAGVLVLLLGLVLLFGTYLLVGSRLAAGREQDVMYGDLKDGLANATVPVAGQIAAGTPLGIVEIPSLHVEQVFVEGSASEQTAIAPGLRHDTVLPGQAGISVLVGRRATYGRPFADLDQLHPGDTILVTTGQGRFRYVVDLVRTSDARASQVEQVDSRLNLITSDPALTPSRQLVVSAHLDGKALPRSTGTATVAADAPGEGSSSSGIALLLWSQLLLVVAVAVTWAAVRMPGRALWIGATPVVLALLWQVFGALALMLPNTL